MMARVRWVLVLGLVAGAALLLGGCRAVEAPAASGGAAAVVVPISKQVAVNSLPSNRQAVERFAAAWNAENYDGMGAALDESAVVNNPVLPDLHDAKGYVERAKTVHAVIPNYQLTYEEMLADGDHVLARERFTGKIGNTPFTYTGMLLVKLQDGKIVDLYEITDDLAVAKFLGEVPNEQKNADFGWQDAGVEPAGGTGDPLPDKETAERIVRQWWGGGAAQEALVAPGFTYHNPWSGGARTYAERMRLMEGMQAAVGELTFEIAGPLIAERDKVGFRFTLAGDRLTLPGIAIYRLAEGKVAEEWVLWANTTLYSAQTGD